MPSTMRIKDNDCNGYKFTPQTQGDHTSYILVDPDKIEKFDPHKTFRCPIEFIDVNGILGTGPITTRYFNVEVKYEYEMREETSSIRIIDSKLYGK